MKSLIGGFITGLLFTAAFYVLFPLFIKGRMLEFTNEVVSTMIRQGLIIGIVFGIVFYLISLLSQRNKRKKELDEAMRDYFRGHLRDSEE